jgi:antirestriction protein ArdC
MELLISENIENLDQFLSRPENKKPDGSKKFEVPPNLPTGHGFLGLVYNPSTKAAYSGKQVQFLSLLCQAAGLCGQFAGYRQWNELGRVVKKGQKAVRIFVPKFKKSEDGQEAVYFRMVTVFAFEQTEPLPEASEGEVANG